MTADPAAELHTIIDLIRYGASRFNASDLTFGHSYDNALDEATQLVLHTLHLPNDLGPAYGVARVTTLEKAGILALFERRIRERVPVAYLIGEAWFAAGRSALLLVPSIPARVERNILINPAHPDAQAISFELPEPIWWDDRLYG